MNRTRQITVSAYQPNRVHESRWLCGEKGPIGASFVGALDTGRTITAAVWTSCGPVTLSGASFTTTAAQTTVQPTSTGNASAKLTVTLDNGEKRVQCFRLTIR